MLRGDVYALRPPRRARAREQRGARFGVVIQADELLMLSTVVVAPTSTRSIDSSFHPRVTVAGRETTVLVEQLAAVDHGRLGDPHGRLAPAELEAVDDALRLVLALT